MRTFQIKSKGFTVDLVIAFYQWITFRPQFGGVCFNIKKAGVCVVRGQFAENFNLLSS